MDKIIIGDVAWLRNDYRQDITVGGITYPTLEHAYQASKTKDRSLKRQISETDEVRAARRLGRENPQGDDFDREKAMEALLRLKFSDKALGEMLANTGSAPIVMEGYDDFWGTGNTSDGQNMMGEMLQTIRSELQFVYGIDPEEDEDDCDGDCDDCQCCDDEDVPTLKDALINNPDEELAVACQNLFDGAKAIVSLLDANDFNAAYIAKKTGAPLAQIEDAIKKVQKFQETLTALDDLLEEPSDEDDDDDSDSDSDESDEDDQSTLD